MNQKEQTKNQQHKSLSSILEYPFDFQRYIEEQLREIDDLDERRFMKRIMVEGLGSMIRQTERKYQELENRIYRETAVPASAYGIVFTIIKKEHYDPANDTLYPVCPMDFNPKVCGEELSTEEYQYIGTVFLQADRQTCREFEARGTYAGVMLVEGEEAPATIHIRKAERYRHGVTDLYRMFLDNHIRWETVNTGYLDKFYDIFVSRKGMPEGAFPGDIKICFGEYGEMVQKDMMPLWNIERLSFSGRSFMMPCTDGISYEHELLLENTGYEDGYLVRMNDDILGIRHEEGKIIIKSCSRKRAAYSCLSIPWRRSSCTIYWRKARKSISLPCSNSIWFKEHISANIIPNRYNGLIPTPVSPKGIPFISSCTISVYGLPSPAGIYLTFSLGIPILSAINAASHA